MKILIEVLSVIWQVISWFFTTIFNLIIDNLPELLELKEIMGYLTPIGMIAAILGVSTGVVSTIIWIVKNGRQVLDWIDRNLIENRF